VGASDLQQQAHRGSSRAHSTVSTG
jgi:hypothetical protein